METGCGGPDCPWLVRVDAGRRVNITLVDFARSHDDDDDEPNVTNDARDCKVRRDSYVTFIVKQEGRAVAGNYGTMRDTCTESLHLTSANAVNRNKSKTTAQQ